MSFLLHNVQDKWIESLTIKLLVVLQPISLTIIFQMIDKKSTGTLKLNYGNYNYDWPLLWSTCRFSEK